MIVLDEDLNDPAIVAALGRFPAVRFVSQLAPTGLDDEDVIGRLAPHKNLVFVTNNSKDFWYRINAPRRSSILCLQLDTKEPQRVSALIRRVLSLSEFASHRARAGLVIRASENRVWWYRDWTQQDRHSCETLSLDP